VRDLLAIPDWQMTAGERLALEGALATLRPRLSIEIGTASGGSLRCIARHSGAVHSFDLEHDPVLTLPRNVTLHTGDSHKLLPRFLDQLARDGKTAEFALVDGDHTAAGVERDLHDLLHAEALFESVIAVHDSANEEVRRGIVAALSDPPTDLSGVELDLVAGHLSVAGPWAGELWGGFALLVRGGEALAQLGRSELAPTADVLAAGRDALTRRVSP
jgi:Methyltransferase domain